MSNFGFIEIDQFDLYGPPPAKLYGPPPSLTKSLSELYGPPPSLTKSSSILSLILSPFFVIISFIVGTILFFITHKKIFIIIPLVFAIIFLLNQVFDISGLVAY